MKSQEPDVFSPHQTKITVLTALVGIALALWVTHIIVTIAVLATVFFVILFFLQENAQAIRGAFHLSESVRRSQEGTMEGLRLDLSDTQEQVENFLLRNDALDKELVRVMEDQCRFEALFRAKAAQVEALQMRNRNLNAEMNGGPPIRQAITMQDWRKMDPAEQLIEIRNKKEEGK